MSTNHKSFSRTSYTNDKSHLQSVFLRVAGITIATIGFFFAIQLIGFSFQSIGKNFTDSFSIAFANPAIGLLIGLLGTTILQSSSTTTSMAVAAVAAGSISLEHAIPIVMGANVGTTLTSTIVSMSYVTKTAEFRKAVSAGTVHDIFNILTCLLLLPLELKYGLLSNLSHSLSAMISVSENSVIGQNWLELEFLDKIGLTLVDWFGAYILLAISVGLLFGTVKIISNILYKQLIGKAKLRFEQIAFQNTLKSFGWGFILTSIIQSSSLTTSLIVPLVATGKVKLTRAFQFIIGANLGTTITALLAAIFKSEAALSLAMAHFLFNTAGMIIFLGVPVFRKIPIFLSNKLGSIALKYKLSGFAYIVAVFFLIPFSLIYFSDKSSQPTVLQTSEVSENKHQIEFKH